MSKRPGFFSPIGVVVAVLLVAAVIAITVIASPFLFSPGSLNAQAKTAPLGGVASHAQLGNDCGACHTAPWSSQRMADKCVACHADVGAQISGQNGLHGTLPAMRSAPCGDCHPDHNGPNGALTSLDEANFPHAVTGFALTGKHATLACSACHTGGTFVGAPTDCNSCHAKDDKHNGSFGTQCGGCHSTSSWAGASFNHDIFPVNHGTDKQQSTCQTCHPNGTTTYTCFGCHQHTQANVVGQHEGQSLAALTDCIKCHAGGKVPD
jgi:hypothetical protein